MASNGALERKGCHLVQASEAQVEGFSWIKLFKLQWRGEDGVQRPWEAVRRTTRQGDVDAVELIAYGHAGARDYLVCVCQYRPPLDSYCIEFPAGLIDAGESPAMAAVRELKEECGFEATVSDVTVSSASDPGITNANLCFVMCDIDMELPANQSPSPSPEETEFIQQEIIPLPLLKHVLLRKKKRGLSLDSRLLALALGLPAVHKRPQGLSVTVTRETVALASVAWLVSIAGLVFM